MIVALVVLPFAAAVLAFLTKRWGPLLGLAATGGSVAAGLALALGIARTGPVVHQLGGWGAPVGIVLRADGFAAVMLLMSAVTALPIALYAGGYYASRSAGWTPGEAFWPLALFLLGALNTLFLSADLFDLYVTLELLTLAAVALVLLEGEDAALMAALRYLLAAFVASMMYLLGVGLLYAAYGSLDMETLAANVVEEPASFVAAALITAGLLLKTALFPLHFWLPRAHAAAPAPVSALLSSLVVTGSFYLLIRLWIGPLAPVVNPGAGQLVGWLGTAAILWGSVQALRQQHLKVMIAYSTVAQVGYLFLLVPLLTSAMKAPDGFPGWGLDAWNGAVYHAVSHALAKAAMFLAAGTIVYALGSDRIVGISGIARRLPVTTYAFGIASMTLIGLPPSGGFVAKWLLLSASLSSGQWWWAVVMVVGGILTAGYVFLVLGQELSRAASDHDVELRSVPRVMEYAAMALALIALALGVRVTEPLALLGIGFPLLGDGSAR